MNKIWLFVLCVFLLSVSHSPAEESMKDNANWWVKTYGAVTAKENNLAERAYKVFSRVSAAADKSGVTFPKLVIIREKGDPYAVAIKDGSIILTQGALKLCYQGVNLEKGDARLALILGHELAHLAKNDFWHANAFSAVKAFSSDREAGNALLRYLETSDVNDSKNAVVVAKMKELQADSYGIIYMSMAGYDAKSVVDRDGTNFFQEWVSQITGKVAYADPDHPSPVERAEFVRTQLAPVIEEVDLFNFGVRLYQAGEFEDAIILLDKFREKFPSREVLNNIGLSHYQIAMQVLSNCDSRLTMRFKLSTILDLETLAGKLISRGSKGEMSLCFQNDSYRKYIMDAVNYLEISVKKDPQYIPSRINLSSAYVMAGEYTKAMSIVEEALKIQPDNLDALNNKAVALYLFGVTVNGDMADFSIAILKDIIQKNPSFSTAKYNMAAIQAERGREAAAKKNLQSFLKNEETGPYTIAVKKRLGMVVDDKKIIPKETASIKSPVKLGEISELTEKFLQGMKKKEVPIGKSIFEIYEGKGLKILAIGGFIEVVEMNLEKSQALNEFKKAYGEPLNEIYNLSGSTLIYQTFAADLRDGMINKVILFEQRG